MVELIKCLLCIMWVGKYTFLSTDIIRDTLTRGSSVFSQFTNANVFTYLQGIPSRDSRLHRDRRPNRASVDPDVVFG